MAEDELTSIVDRGTRTIATRAVTGAAVSATPLGLGERLLLAVTLKAGCLLIAVVEWLPPIPAGSVVRSVRKR
jgi:hypothetical protein